MIANAVKRQPDTAILKLVTGNRRIKVEQDKERHHKGETRHPERDIA